MGMKYGGGGGGQSVVATINLADLPAPSVANIGLEVDVADLNGGTRLKSNGTIWYQVSAGVAAEGSSTLFVDASRNLAAADAGMLLKCRGSSAITLTLPAGLPARFGCAVMQCGTGKVTIAATGPAAVHAQGSKFSTAAQYAVIEVLQTDVTDDYLVTGQSGT
jgi:hypothetical protein